MACLSLTAGVGALVLPSLRPLVSLFCSSVSKGSGQVRFVHSLIIARLLTDLE